MSAPGKNTPEDFMNAMILADVLEIFRSLPLSAQDEFSAWVAKARDDGSLWQRIDALVLALRTGMLQKPASEESQTNQDVAQ